MLGRRRHSRYLLAQPVEGHLRVREEVTIKKWSGSDVVVLASEPCACNERLTLEVPGPLGRRLHVQVVECRPAVTDEGAILHRCRLAILEAAADCAGPAASEP
ncbi:MAG TPA: hypothetical protein PLN93_07805 [Vicinamibacterales bacterium]|nr:hypothetical protein [Vicinamibacterales bacterium]HOQ59532.1 hypothetical protein [Vicinamibacterales bacterium]HPK71830.1 hypothetical protein [Vicinamibacterales bacterium]